MLTLFITRLYVVLSLFIKIDLQQLTLSQNLINEIISKPISEYQSRLNYLSDLVDSLPETLINADGFNPINYRLVVSRFTTVKPMLDNLKLLADKFSDVVDNPLEIDTDIPNFVSLSLLADNSTLLANFLTYEGQYQSIRSVILAVRKYTGEMNTLYTQMKELENLDSEYISYFERMSVNTIRETIAVMERLNNLGDIDV